MDRNSAFVGEEVKLQEVLFAREQRVLEQKALLKENPDCCLISFTAMMPGPVKVNEVSTIIIEEGQRAIEAKFNNFVKKTLPSKGGTTVFYLIKEEALEVKKKCIEIEKEHELGRLFDIDVLDKEARILSRTELGFAPRGCLVCNKEGSFCSRSRAHSVEDLLTKIFQMVDGYGRT